MSEPIPATDPRRATHTPRRILGYDLARSWAIIGMVLINFPGHLGVNSEARNGIGPWLADLPSGRASSLFVALAGAGIALMANGAPRGKVRWTLLRRSLFLLVSGYALRELWSIDILHFYGFYLLCAALFFLALPRRALIPFAAAIAISAGLVYLQFDAAVDYDVGQWTVQGIAQDVIGWGIHPLLPWLSFLLVGMWVGKHDLNDADTRRRLMVRGATAALVAQWLSFVLPGVFVAAGVPLDVVDYVGVDWSPEPLFVLSACGSATFLIAAAQEVFVRAPDSRVWRALIATGQLSFTVYVTHALLGCELWTRTTDWFDDMPHAWVMAYALGFCLVVVLLVSLYRTRFRRGPLEFIMRKTAGATPKKTESMQLQMLAPPPRWAFPAAGAFALLLIAVQFTGPSLRPGCRDALVATDATVAGLSLTCPEQPFALSLDADSEVEIRTRSAGLDLYLEVYRDDEMVADNDDFEGDLDARVWTRLEAGEYRIVVRPYASAVGTFVLTTAISPAEELADDEVCENTCRYAGDGDCDDGGPDYDYTLCDFGTDCEDCGVRSESDRPPPPEPGTELCTDECPYANDGDCDDGGPDHDYDICPLGSDCGDCGVRIAPELEE